MAPSKDNEGFPSGTESNDLGWPHRNERGYEIHEEPYDTPRKLRVIHVGMGASGIIFSKFYEEKLKNVELQIYEKNADVGGTWLENRYVYGQILPPSSLLILSPSDSRYPGCACDIPSAAYQFTWERNPNWSRYYSESPEIWRYFKSVVDKHGLIKYVKLQHMVTGAFWDSEKGLWKVHIRRPDGSEFEDSCNVLINGSGILKCVPFFVWQTAYLLVVLEADKYLTLLATGSGQTSKAYTHFKVFYSIVPTTMKIRM